MHKRHIKTCKILLWMDKRVMFSGPKGHLGMVGDLDRDREIEGEEKGQDREARIGIQKTETINVQETEMTKIMKREMYLHLEKEKDGSGIGQKT